MDADTGLTGPLSGLNKPEDFMQAPFYRRAAWISVLRSGVHSPLLAYTARRAASKASSSLA